MTEPILVTIDAAASLLSLSRRKLDKMRLLGEIETVKIGNKRLVPMREVRRLASEPNGTDRNPIERPVVGAVAGSENASGEKITTIQLFRQN